MKVTYSYTPGAKSDPSASASRWRRGHENLTRAISFLDEYPWQRIAEASETSVVVEEIGRNTGAIFGWRFEGTPEEIQPLNQYLYLRAAIGAACYCSLRDDYREKQAVETAEKLQRFPENACTPLPFACLCFQEPEFTELGEAFTTQISTAENLVLLERIPSQSQLSDYEWSSTMFASAIAAMLVAGISTPKDIVAGVKVATAYPDPKRTEDLLAAVEFSREGLCSFQEALEL